MTTKVQKWGNSLAVRIPSNIAESTGIERGTELVLEVKDQYIVLKKKEATPTLDELLSKITPDNRHDEVFMGQEGDELL
ncbi:AbrB/MazE/SpoVT family DNA-binding domain-containing protein [Sporolactobacillus shoreae]|uniref:AbrB/MazE/SpoVT family DNA-binding domain-containing protein n=1 Tax=Sporolactobacillus shoreae TaxID=1465501 RepID=A0A4Z0GK79_9BACL|nr:AbrB/MazE/SpoVT family DNA-binding domain-containing protein [Sporolactobacillus shoreae]